jgi:2-polyprenyl-3-methyl-5-hydroxy-6-metoxy-1,4-benzoquinol methylase
VYEKLHPQVRSELEFLGWRRRSFDGGLIRLIEAMGLAQAFGEARDLTSFFATLQTAQASWLYYFMDSIRRGDRMINYASDKIVAGAQFLDVGCGYGGSLVAAHNRGMRVHGIEIDPKALGGARALLSEHGIEGLVTDTNIHEPAFDALPPMDLIVCENVIEHVDDPRGFMQRMFGRLAPGGALVLEIPNGFSLRSVLSDPHYALPFLSLLPQASAHRIFDDVIRADVCGDGYSVGDYFPLAWYLDVLPPSICHQTIRYREDAITPAVDVPASLLALQKALVNINNTYVMTSHRLRENLVISGSRYIAELQEKMAAAQVQDSTVGDVDPSGFATRYLAAAWIVRFDKPSK